MRSAPILLCAILTAAWSSPIDDQERRPRDAQIATLIADARAAPAEFSADALIRLAGFPQIRTATKIALLDEAFQRAHSARDEYRLSARPELPDDSRQVAQRQAYATGLNRVSLQSRAVQQLACIQTHKLLTKQEMGRFSPALREAVQVSRKSGEVNGR